MREEMKTENPSSSTLRTPEERLTQFIEAILLPIGYELVAIEITNHREKKLCVFIDLPSSDAGVGIEDCVKVTHTLDEPLEGNPELEAIFKGPYELEVSSPGIERPLRKPKDFDQFQGEVARLNTFRPLTGEETRAPEYSLKNPKQKNFYGILRGFEPETASILFGIIPEDGTRERFKNRTPKNKKASTAKPETLIRVPLGLVAKAHLEPAIVIPENKSKE
jgi:ribosome maturation factor RimP